MSSAHLVAHGGRLKYVVLPIKGKVKRMIYRFETKQVGTTERGDPRFQHTMLREIVERPGGYLVYCPMGHVVRLTERQLRRFKLNRPPPLTDMRGRFSADTPAGKTFGEQAEQINRDGVKSLELMTVHLATRKTGTRLLLKEEKIPDEFEEVTVGKLPNPMLMEYKDETAISVE